MPLIRIGFNGQLCADIQGTLVVHYQEQQQDKNRQRETDTEVLQAGEK